MDNKQKIINILEQMQGELIKLNKRQGIVENELKELNDRQDSMEGELKKLNAKQDSMESDIKEIRSDVGMIKNQLIDLKAKNDSKHVEINKKLDKMIDDINFLKHEKFENRQSIYRIKKYRTH